MAKEEDPLVAALDAELGTKPSQGQRIALLVIVALAIFGAIGWWGYQKWRFETVQPELVDEVSGAALGCVTALRGDAPEFYGIERALENQAEMAVVTRDPNNPAVAEERARFLALAEDAARGCRPLGNAMARAFEETPELYFAVPPRLARPTNLENPEAWYRDVIPDTRDRVETLARQIRQMNDAIAQRRSEHQMIAQVLPIEGSDPPPLARILTLPDIPSELERPQTEVWPLDERLVVIRRGAINRVLCDTRFLNSASCYRDFVLTVSWEGEISELRELTRPDNISYWNALAPAPDGSLFGMGRREGSRGVYLARYAPGESVAADVRRVEGIEVDGLTTLAPVPGGMGILPEEGSAFVAPREDPLAFSAVEHPPLPLVWNPGFAGPEHGVSVPDRGRLSIRGNPNDGYTARLFAVGDHVPTPVPVIDARTRVASIIDLRASSGGKVVALLNRGGPAPDAIVLSSDMGLHWLAAPAASE